MPATSWVIENTADQKDVMSELGAVSNGVLTLSPKKAGTYLIKAKRSNETIQAGGPTTVVDCIESLELKTNAAQITTDGKAAITADAYNSDGELAFQDVSVVFSLVGESPFDASDFELSGGNLADSRTSLIVYPLHTGELKLNASKLVSCKIDGAQLKNSDNRELITIFVNQSFEQTMYN